MRTHRPDTYPCKADGPNHHVIGHIETDLIASALEEIGAPQGWPVAKRDRHRVLEQGRSLILRDERHRDTPSRARFRSVETIVNRVCSLGYGATPGKIVAAYLPPGKVTRAHRDSGQYYTFHNRIHVPLATSAGVVMTVGGEDFHMSVGNVYLFQNLRRHAVRNGSETGRLHLIVDMLDPRYSADFYQANYWLLSTNLFGFSTRYRERCHLATSGRRFR